MASRHIHPVKLFSQSVSADLCKSANIRAQYLFTLNCAPICAKLFQMNNGSLNMKGFVNLRSANLSLWKYLCFPMQNFFFLFKILCVQNLSRSTWETGYCWFKTQFSKTCLYYLPVCLCKNSIFTNLFVQNLSRWTWEAGGFPANLLSFFPISSLQPPLWEHFLFFWSSWCWQVDHNRYLSTLIQVPHSLSV